MSSAAERARIPLDIWVSLSSGGIAKTTPPGPKRGRLIEVPWRGRPAAGRSRQTLFPLRSRTCFSINVALLLERSRDYKTLPPAIRGQFSLAMQGYVNLKAYGEFDARNRPSGWNGWLTLSISPAAPTARL